MGKIVRFLPRSERERARLIEEARAIYGGIFPPADAAAVSGKAHVGQAAIISSGDTAE
jgi:hypothetical protein